MKYGDIRRAVLSRVRMYSIAGVEIPASYNLQADELGRIPLLINEALFHILTAVRRERETVELTGGKNKTDLNLSLTMQTLLRAKES